MRDLVPKLCRFGPLALLLAITLAACPLFACSVGASLPAPRTKGIVHALPAIHPQIGVTKGYANVRSQASAYGTLLATYPPGTIVTIYASVNGQVLWHGSTGWDRISQPGSPPRYVYGALIVVTSGHPRTGSKHAKPTKLRAIAPSPIGKEIVISIARQWMFVYDKGKRMYDAPVTTGQASLSTPTGIYHVLAKLSPTTFYSPWPPGSPYWYPATHINYALQWKEGGFFLHDSWWRTLYGPGTNVYHHDPIDGWMNGTHGCITMPLSAAVWLYKWAPIGTMVRIGS